MQINSFHSFFLNTYCGNLPKAKSNSKKNISEPSLKPVYSNQLASKGINFGAKTINQMYDEYNWYINNDKNTPIDAFLKIEDSKESMDSFLTSILNSEDKGYQLIDSISKHPQNNAEIHKKLKEKVGNNSVNVLTFIPNSPYSNAYNNFLDKKFQNTNTINELLKIRPDWKGEALIEKNKQLKGNDNIEIGSIPKEFPDNHLFQIIDYLEKDIEKGAKTQKDIKSLTLNNRTYNFNFFTEGKSDKNVFGVNTPENKKFVIKMAEEKYRSLDAPFALGTLAKIDTYLTTNRSKNSAPICYYNHNKNTSVYKFIEHSTTINGNNKNLKEINDHLPDFKSLGLTYNDNVGCKNLFQLDELNIDKFDNNNVNEAIKSESEWISVDNDHVTFNNSLQPSTKYNSTLPNAMQMFF